jgi:hypothetical protein
MPPFYEDTTHFILGTHPIPEWPQVNNPISKEGQILTLDFNRWMGDLMPFTPDSLGMANVEGTKCLNDCLEQSTAQTVGQVKL